MKLNISKVIWLIIITNDVLLFKKTFFFYTMIGLRLTAISPDGETSIN